MRKRKELHGIAVVDVTGGKKLGSVADLVVAPENGRIVALTVGGGMLGSPSSYVAAEDVRAIGSDAVTVEADNVVRRESEMPDGLREAWSASRDLVGKKVVTQNGTYVGTVSDYLIDESALRVTGLTIGGGLLSGEDAVAADRIVSLGPDAVIVTDTDDAGEDAGRDRRSPWTD